MTFVCAPMLAHSIPSPLHRPAGVTVKSKLAGSTGLNHFISPSCEPSLRRKANTAEFVFSEGSVSIVSHFASNSIKNSYCFLDAALKKTPRSEQGTVRGPTGSLSEKCACWTKISQSCGSSEDFHQKPQIPLKIYMRLE